MARIGVFGGAFNPLHIGHLINAEFVSNEFNLDKILFIPTNIPAHKPILGGVSKNIRIKMVKKAIKNHIKFKFSDIEVKKEQISYTFNTLTELKQIYKNDILFLIIGNEWLEEFNTWYRYKDIFNYAKIIILKRIENKYNKNHLPIFLKKYKQNLLFANNPVINISSTYIRDLIKKNFNVKYMIPDTVLKYIKKYRLYQGVTK